MKKIASIVAIASALVATSLGNAALAENTSSLPDLLGHWTFEDGEELVEKTGNWGILTLMGDDANIWDGELHVTGGDAAWAYARDYQGPIIREKTLISWVNLNLLDVGSGSVLTIDGINEDNFDGIVYGERVPQRWMAGSSSFLRTQDVMAVDETSRDLLQLAISYKDVGNNQVEITLCHDGVQIGQYTSNNMAQWEEGDAEVIFGKRHTPSGTDGPGEVEARIEEARIYGGSMTCEQVAALDTTDTETTTESDTSTGTINVGDLVVMEIHYDESHSEYFEVSVTLVDFDEYEDTSFAEFEYTSFTNDCTHLGGRGYIRDAISLEAADDLGLTVQKNWGCSE